MLTFVPCDSDMRAHLEVTIERVMELHKKCQEVESEDTDYGSDVEDVSTYPPPHPVIAISHVKVLTQNSIYIRQVSFGEAEHQMHSHYLLLRLMSSH